MLQDAGAHTKEIVQPVQEPVATHNISQAAAEPAPELAPLALDVAEGTALETALAEEYMIHIHAQHVQQGNTAVEGRQGVALIVE